MADLKEIASGDKTTGHVITAAILGAGLSAIGVWVLQNVGWPPPPDAAQGITAVAIVLASWIMQKVSA